MIRLLKRILTRKSYPLNKIYVNGSQLVKNYQYLASINPRIKVAPVLKSNAYGHGIELVGKILDKNNPPFICVDSLYEANQLIKAKVKTPILIMGYIDPQSLMRKKLPYSYAIWDLESAGVLNSYQKGASIHLFVDTGMHREGVLLKDLEKFIQSLKQFQNIKIDGLMTHLAMADKPDDPLTKTQFGEFIKAKEIAKKTNLNIKWFHIGGGVTILASKNPPCNLIRVGKILYGIDPLTEIGGLKPCLRLVTKLVQIKQISIGDRIGYDGTFTAKSLMTIGTLPIGYNDGVDRRLSGKGYVLIDKKYCQILGRISMNVTTIDLTGVINPKVGDEVLVYSDNPTDKNSIQSAAEIADTIPYDLMVHLATSTKRETAYNLQK